MDLSSGGSQCSPLFQVWRGEDRGTDALFLSFLSSLGSIQGCWGHPWPVCSLKEASKTPAHGKLLQQSFYRVLEVWKCSLPCLHPPPPLPSFQGNAQKSDPGWDAEVSCLLFDKCTEASDLTKVAKMFHFYLQDVHQSPLGHTVHSHYPWAYWHCSTAGHGRHHRRETPEASHPPGSAVSTYPPESHQWHGA